MLYHGALTAVLLLGGVWAASVSPPSNVTVSCKNFNILVRWDYSTREPHTSFRGEVLTDGWNCTFETAQHQYNLSQCEWKGRYMDSSYVAVAAVQGGRRSTAVNSNTFSFHALKTVSTHCSLEFPPVEVKVDESKTTVSFPNPLSYYEELKQMNLNGAEFEFTVSPAGNEMAQGDVGGLCTKEQSTCRGDVFLSEGLGGCVTLTGTLSIRKGVEWVQFTKTPEICPDPDKENEMMLAVILVSVLFFVVVVIIICICKVKAWTMQTPILLPKSLTLSDRKGPVLSGYQQASREDVIHVSGCEPVKRLSVSSADSNHSDNSAKYLYATQHLDSGNQELEATRLIYEQNGTDNDSGDDSIGTESVSLEEEVSPYDCPHVFREMEVDMGDGDMVTGYTGD